MATATVVPAPNVEPLREGSITVPSPSAAPPSPYGKSRAGEEDIVKVARSFVPRLIAAQAESDRLARVPADLVEEMHQAGLFSLGVPSEHGGSQANLSTWMEVISELGRGNGGVSWAATLINTCNWVVPTLYPKSVVDEVFATPNARVAGVFSSRQMKAHAAPGGIFVEKGVWMFNSGVQLAQWDLLGVPLPNEDGEMTGRGVALLPMSDVTILDDWDTVGLRGSGSSTVSVENVFIPNERLVEMKGTLEGKYHGAFNDRPLYRSAFMPLTAIVLTFPVLGLGMHMMEEVLAKMPTRNIPYSAYSKSGEAAVTHLQMGEAFAKLEAARLMVAKCCSDIEEWAEKGESMPYLDRARARLYSGAADKTTWEAVDILASTGGGSFARRANVLNRIWEDVRVAIMHGIIAPASNFELYGRLLNGLDANMMLV